MAAPRGAADSGNTAIYVMVVFIVLFLAASVLSIVMFMSNEKLVKQANDAQDELDNLGSRQELNEVKQLTRREGGRTISSLKQLNADMRYLCEMIGGQDLPNFSLVGAKALADERVEGIWEVLESGKLTELLENPQDMSRQNGLANTVNALIGTNESMVNLYQSADQNYKLTIQSLQQQIEQKEAQANQLQADLDAVGKAAGTYEQQSSNTVAKQRDEYEQIIQQRDKERDQLQVDMEQLQKEFDGLGAMLDQYNQKIKELEKVLQTVRPTPEMEMFALDPDGFVVEVVPREKLVYINLARVDHIYRGLTFSVYDSYRTIPKDGKGKGTVEVIEIMDTISKCRVIESDSTNPIMKKDIIANLIWDKDKQFEFCVAGDFDFDGDGHIDPGGRKRIETLIKGWGGTVSDLLSVGTDFLVLGYPPVIPAQPLDEFLDTNAPEAVAYRQTREQALNYEQILENGKSLGVPTFNMNRFLRFIGYYHKSKK